MILAEEIARWLGANVSGLTYSDTHGGNLFVDNMPSAPARAVAVYPSGGWEASDKLPYDYPTLAVRVRGDEDPRWALEMAQSVYDYLQGLHNVALPGGTWLVYCIAMQSGPIRLGQNQAGQFEYSLNFRLEIRNPTPQRINNS